MKKELPVSELPFSGTDDGLWLCAAGLFLGLLIHQPFRQVPQALAAITVAPIGPRLLAATYIAARLAIRIENALAMHVFHILLLI